MTVSSKNPPAGDGVARTARERSNLYGFLSGVYRAEPTAALIKEIKAPAFQEALEATGAGEAILPNGDEAESLLEDLAVEYTRLFIGPGDHVAPYAAVYLGGEGASLWGPETAWVKNFIEAAGFDYRPDYHDLPDHIAVELEFMREITANEGAAVERGDQALAEMLRRIEEEFLTDHLAKWVPAFCSQVRDRAALPFYRVMARLTEGFICADVVALKRGAG